MRWFQVVCLTILGAGCQVVPPSESIVDPALAIVVNLEAQVLWPSVQLKVREGQWGSGVIVGWDGQTARILSAAHLFEDHQDRPVTIYVIEPTPWAFEAQFVWQAGEADLALLEGTPTPGLIPHVAPLWPPEAAGPQRFTPVIGVGSPPFMQWVIPSSGWISQLAPRVMVTSTAWFGSSGGPIFVEHAGEWKVWAVTSGIPRTTSHGLTSWITNLVYVVPVAGWLGKL